MPATTDIAKPAVDIGIVTNNLQTMLTFYGNWVELLHNSA